MTAHSLPVALGASTDVSGGGDRPESITSDQGNRPAVPRETVAPRQPAAASTVADVLADEAAAPAPVASPAPAGGQDAGIVTDEEIDALHARFDRMETLLKRRLAIGTLDARFDHLEKWLAARLGPLE